MLTPLATVLLVALVMFTPLALLSELPARVADAESFVVTVEPATAMDVSPAVTLLIWPSVISCALECLELSLLWAAAIPAVRKDAVMRVQTILFT